MRGLGVGAMVRGSGGPAAVHEANCSREEPEFVSGGFGPAEGSDSECMSRVGGATVLPAGPGPWRPAGPGAVADSSQSPSQQRD